MLLSNRRLQFLDLAVLFQELVEQHRIHCFIANGERLALVVPCHQVGIYLFHIFSNKAELWDALRVKLVLVTESYRL